MQYYFKKQLQFKCY